MEEHALFARQPVNIVRLLLLLYVDQGVLNRQFSASDNTRSVCGLITSAEYFSLCFFQVER